MDSRSTEAEVLKAVLALLDAFQIRGLLSYRRMHSGARIFGGRRVRSHGNRGIPDVFVISNGRFGWMELKRPKGGVLSEDQIEFRDQCRLHRIPWVEVKSVGQAIEFLKQELNLNGLPTILAG